MKSSLTSLFCSVSACSLLGCVNLEPRPQESDEGMKDHAQSVGHPRKVIKLSTKTYGDASNAENEIKAFYLHLLESDKKTKLQFESLTEELRDEYGGIFHAYDPQVIEWFPSEHSWNAPEEFETDGNYLVIQPIGYGRSRRSGYETVIVSEFNVTDNGKALQDNSRKNPEDDRISTTMKITFLGFRNYQINPIKHQK